MARIHEMLILTGTVCAITAELVLAMNDAGGFTNNFICKWALYNICYCSTDC